MAILISVLILTLNSNSSQAIDTTSNFYKEQQARLIANSGVEIFLERLRRNKSLTGTFLDNSLMDGTYDVYISGPDSNLTIKAIGKYYDKVHTTIVSAKRDPISMPDVNSAMYISSQTLNAQLSGNMNINGNDVNMNGTPGSGTPLPGIGVDDPSDSAYIINDIKPKISNTINGLGGSPSVHTVNDNTDWEKLTENIIFAADNTIPAGTYSSGSYGTASQPAITYANGDVKFTGNLTGYGIMVINGDLSLSGTFNFYGIIIVYGQSSITTNLVGTSGIYGGLIVIGQNVDIKSTGSSSIFYSSQAIQNAKVNLKSSRFTIVSWWE